MPVVVVYDKENNSTRVFTEYNFQVFWEEMVYGVHLNNPWKSRQEILEFLDDQFRIEYTEIAE